MSHLIKKALILFALITTLSCKVQNNYLFDEVGLEDNSIEYGLDGKYYKDLNNTLNNFTGTYLYTNGSTSFKIILQKKIESSVNNVYKEDILIGSYKYIENGILKIDDLNNINTNHSNGWLYNIHGNDILVGQTRGCDECEINEKWIRGTIIDPLQNGGGPATLFIRKVMVGSQEAIKIWIYMEMFVATNGSDPIESVAYPTGEEFILLKQ